MNNAKHTPGPWSVFNHSWCETSISAPSTDNAICLIDINHATEETQEADEAQMAANARLIATAPELLEALQIIFNDVKQGAIPNSDDEWWGKARAAIEKATGEQP